MNRRLHFLGTSLALFFLLFAIITENAWWLIAVPVSAYAFAWIGHFLVEKNRPLSFEYPLWSLMADFHMFAFMCAGRMEREVKRMGVLNQEV